MQEASPAKDTTKKGAANRQTHAFLQNLRRISPPPLRKSAPRSAQAPAEIYCKGKIRTTLFRRGKTRLAGIRQSRPPRLFRLPLLFAKFYDVKFCEGCGMNWTPCRSSSLQYGGIAASSSRQSIPKFCRKKCEAIKSGKTGAKARRSPQAVPSARSRTLTQYRGKIRAFDRVPIISLQYNIR